jgi:hypothetical protein
MAACNIWSSLQESATVDISCLISVHDYAFKMLIADIHEDLAMRKRAFLMTQLLQKYLDCLPAHIPNTYPPSVIPTIF